MSSRVRTLAGAALPAVFMLLACGRLPALDVAGSLFTRAGPGFPPEGLPAESLPAWSGEMQASGRVTGEAGAGTLALQARYTRDYATGADDLLVEEAWAGWKPLDPLMFKLGRQRVGFGCGIAWSVVDDLDPAPMPFDTHTPRPGLDALRATVDFSSLSAPVQVSAETFVPAGLPAAVQAAPQLHDLGAAAQVSAFVAGMEAGAAVSVKGLGRDPPLAMGGWATVDLAGFVFGFEGAWKRNAAGPTGGAQLLVNCNRRMGDAAAAVEARWVPDDSRVWLFGQLSWSRADVGASAAALFSLREQSGLLDLTVSYNASEALVISAGAAAFEKPDLIPEIGPFPWRFAVTLGAEYFF